MNPLHWLHLHWLPFQWLTLGFVLLTTLALGICLHELLHLVPLSFTDASYTITVLPTDEDDADASASSSSVESSAMVPSSTGPSSTSSSPTSSSSTSSSPTASSSIPSSSTPSSPTSSSPTTWTALQSALTSGLVRVEITHVPQSTPDWVLRVAALLPVLLAVPLLLVGVGVLPNPLAADDHAAALALVALTGCGLPSPADWSVVWHGSELQRDD